MVSIRQSHIHTHTHIFTHAYTYMHIQYIHTSFNPNKRNPAANALTDSLTCAYVTQRYAPRVPSLRYVRVPVCAICVCVNVCVCVCVFEGVHMH